MSTRTGMFPPPNAPTPFQPGGMPPMQGAPNPFAPMPPMPLAGMPSPPMGGMPPPPPMGPPPPMAPPPMGAGLGSSAGVIQSSNAPRRRIFGDYLESTLSGGQPRSAPPQAQMAPPVDPRYSQAPQFAMRPDSRQARPLMNGGIVNGYHGGGPVGHKHIGGNEDSAVLGSNQGLIESMQLSLASDPVQSILTKYGMSDTEINSNSDFYKLLGAMRKGIGSNNLDADAVTDSLTAARYNNQKYNYDGTLKEGFREYGSVSDTLDTVMQTPGAQMQLRGIVQSALNKNPAGSDAYLSARHSGDRYLTDAEVAERNRALGLTRMVSSAQPISQITGADSGPGSVVNAGGNFGTGTYTADPVDSSEINPIDYSQFTGDVGNFSNTGENFAFYGPKLNIPQSVSQYMTDPITGGLTTSYGPEMAATSPIGAIKLPARPVSIDIFDWLSTPTYGTMYSGINKDISGYADGGSVVQYYEDAGEVKRIDQIYSDLTPAQKFDVTNEQLRKMGDSTGRFGRSEFVEGSGIGTDYLGYSEDSNRFYDTSNIDDIYGNLTMDQKIAVTNPQLLMLATGEGRFDDNRFVDIAAEQAALKKAAEDEAARLAADEAARLAADEAARLAADEAARLAAEDEAARLAAEDEAARLRKIGC